LYGRNFKAYVPAFSIYDTLLVMTVVTNYSNLVLHEGNNHIDQDWHLAQWELQFDFIENTHVPAFSKQLISSQKCWEHSSNLHGSCGWYGPSSFLYISCLVLIMQLIKSIATSALVSWMNWEASIFFINSIRRLLWKVSYFQELTKIFS